MEHALAYIGAGKADAPTTDLADVLDFFRWYT